MYHRLTFIPKNYDWDAIYLVQRDAEKVDGTVAMASIYKESQAPPAEDKASCMRNYNTALRKWINYSLELIRIDTLNSNLSDDKRYPLSLKQISVLGF